MSAKKKIKTVKAICADCDGSGLYEGMFEKAGYPVVCLVCEGTGCEEISYIPFTKRKLLRGIKGVSLSAGRFIATGVGATGDRMSYKDFLSGKFKESNP